MVSSVYHIQVATFVQIERPRGRTSAHVAFLYGGETVVNQNSEQIIIRVPPEVKRTLEELARQNERSVTRQITWMVRQAAAKEMGSQIVPEGVQNAERTGA